MFIHFFYRPKKNVHENDEIRNGNTLYASKTSFEFGIIANFLKQNPTEIVIIDLNGDWFEMDANLYKKLKDEMLLT